MALLKVVFSHENVCQDHCAHEDLRDLCYLERNFPFLLWSSLLQHVLEGPWEALSPSSECGSGAVLACNFPLALRHHFLCAKAAVVTARWACNMSWLSLHDHGPGHNRGGIFSWKEMWFIQRIPSPVSALPPTFSWQMNERQLLLQYKLN